MKSSSILPGIYITALSVTLTNVSQYLLQKLTDIYLNRKKKKNPDFPLTKCLRWTNRKKPLLSFDEPGYSIITPESLG